MHAFVNNVKTVFLLGLLFGLIVLVGSAWGKQGMIIAGVLAAVMNLGAWFFSDSIAIAAMRGQPADRRQAPQLVSIVEDLAQRAGIPVPRIFICPHDAPNAFATGRNPRHSAVAITHGALRLLDEDELRGVMAHEIAHIRNRDTLISTIAATVAGIFSMLAQMSLYIGPGMGGGGDRRQGNPLAALAIILLGAIGAALIKAMISRSREFVADADGARYAGEPEGLISALRKLDAYAQRIPLHQPNPAMNNLFIVEPFVGRTLTELFATHPPIEKRIAALRR